MPHYNIAFYSDSYLPAVDGVVTSMLNFKRELEKRGHNVYIFATCRLKDRKKYARKDVFLYPGIAFKPYPQYSTAIFPYNSSLTLARLDADVIHVQTPFIMGFTGLLSAKLGGYPLVATFHTLLSSRSLMDYYPKNRMLKRFYSKYVWKYTRFFYRRCDITIAPSHAIAELLRRHKIRNVRVAPTGSVDLERFNVRVSGHAMRKSLGIRDRERVVLYLGRISREKKLEVMLRAAKVMLKKRDDVRFVVGGAGPALDGYKRMARRLGIGERVRFLGFVEDSVLPQIYAACDLLCMPSTFETQGIVPLEAMAMGKPVVGSDSLALRELIQNGKNGERFMPLNHINCAKKMEKVLNNCDSYRKQAMSTARAYSIARVTDKLLKTYEAALSNQAVY